MVVAVTPVPVFVAVMVAPGTNACDGSCTNPVTVALLLCPTAIPMSRNRVRTKDIDAFLMDGPPEKMRLSGRLRRNGQAELTTEWISGPLKSVGSVTTPWHRPY